MYLGLWHMKLFWKCLVGFVVLLNLILDSVYRIWEDQKYNSPSWNHVQLRNFFHIPLFSDVQFQNQETDTR